MRLELAAYMSSAPQETETDPSDQPVRVDSPFSYSTAMDFGFLFISPSSQKARQRGCAVGQLLRASLHQAIASPTTTIAHSKSRMPNRRKRWGGLLLSIGAFSSTGSGHRKQEVSWTRAGVTSRRRKHSEATSRSKIVDLPQGPTANPPKKPADVLRD